MAKIIENKMGRKSIKLSTDDIISIVREYQNITRKTESYSDLRKKLNEIEMILPEELT